MKNKLQKLLWLLWQTATDVPGWPNAPILRRIRHSVPVVLPTAVVIALVVWIYAVQIPSINRARQHAADVIALDDEVAQLRMACSDQQAAEIDEKARQAQRRLVQGSDELNEVMAWLRTEAKNAGWVLNLTKAEVTPYPEDAPIFQLQGVRADLRPRPENTARLASLVSLMERMSTGRVRIDLTHTAIRVDEGGWHPVELGLRVARVLPHEKVAQ